jgi:pimeloyl-ACP methyl ester carboxylesterase
MESRTLDVDGRPVYLADFGGSGDPMVLVHGLGGSHVNWLAVAPRLAERFHVVAPDLAGFGLTPLAGRSAGVDANADLLDRVLGGIGEPVVLVGNSMGGMISLLESARHPERVRAVVLIDPSLPAALSVRRPNLVVVGTFLVYSVPGLGQTFVKRRAARLGPEGMVRETMKLCTADMSRIPKDVYDAHVELARKRQAFAWGTDAYLEAARSIVTTLARRRRYEAVMHSVGAPVLLLHGDTDRLVPLDAARAAARLNPSWRFEVYDDTGHIPMLERPDMVVDSTLRFLDDVLSPAAAPAPRERAVPSAPA